MALRTQVHSLSITHRFSLNVWKKKQLVIEIAMRAAWKFEIIDVEILQAQCWKGNVTTNRGFK